MPDKTRITTMRECPQCHGLRAVYDRLRANDSDMISEYYVHGDKLMQKHRANTGCILPNAMARGYHLAVTMKPDLTGRQGFYVTPAILDGEPVLVVHARNEETGEHVDLTQPDKVLYVNRHGHTHAAQAGAPRPVAHDDWIDVLGDVERIGQPVWPT